MPRSGDVSFRLPFHQVNFGGGSFVQIEIKRIGFAVNCQLHNLHFSLRSRCAVMTRFGSSLDTIAVFAKNAANEHTNLRAGVFPESPVNRHALAVVSNPNGI